MLTHRRLQRCWTLRINAVGEAFTISDSLPLPAKKYYESQDKWNSQRGNKKAKTKIWFKREEVWEIKMCANVCVWMPLTPPQLLSANRFLSALSRRHDFKEIHLEDTKHTSSGLFLHVCLSHNLPLPLRIKSHTHSQPFSLTPSVFPGVKVFMLQDSWPNG